MDFIEKIIEVSQEFGSIHGFCEFTDEVHQNIGCQKNHCNIKCFVGPVKEAVSDTLKDYDSIRNLFIRQSVNYPNVFNCMFELKTEKSEKSAMDLIEGLKILSEAYKHQEEEVEEKSEVKSLLDILTEQKKKIEQQIEIILSHINLAAEK